MERWNATICVTSEIDSTTRVRIQPLEPSKAPRPVAE